jgi:hypothetical protein
MRLMSSGRRLAGLGHKPSKLAIPGSNPGDRTKRNMHTFYLRLVFNFKSRLFAGAGQLAKNYFLLLHLPIMVPFLPFLVERCLTR